MYSFSSTKKLTLLTTKNVTFSRLPQPRQLSWSDVITVVNSTDQPVLLGGGMFASITLVYYGPIADLAALKSVRQTYRNDANVRVCTIISRLK